MVKRQKTYYLDEKLIDRIKMYKILMDTKTVNELLDIALDSLHERPDKVALESTELEPPPH